MAKVALATPPVDREALLQIANVAGHLLEYQLEVKSAHDLGVVPGKCREPWSLERNRQNMSTIVKTMPQSWLKGLGKVSRRTVELMGTLEVDDGIRCHWEIMSRYFENLAVAISEYLDDETTDSVVDLANSPPVPGVLRYDEIAAGVHPEGTAQMIDVARSVDSYCRRAAYGVTEEEICWLRALARSERLLDVGTRAGYSERDFYRAQTRLWNKLGVDGRAQALVKATELGLLEDLEPTGDQADVV